MRYKNYLSCNKHNNTQTVQNTALATVKISINMVSSDKFTF